MKHHSTALVETARRVIAGESPDALVDEHGLRLERLFAALSGGVG